MVVFGILWQNIDFIGLVSFFLSIIDPNSFGLVYLSQGGENGSILSAKMSANLHSRALTKTLRLTQSDF